MIKAELSVYVCDFCAKNQFQVGHMVYGIGGAAICDECVALASGICAEGEDLKALRLDAERYRALRAASNAHMSHVRVIVTYENSQPQVATAEVVDAATDLLLAKQQEKPNVLCIVRATPR